MADKTKRRVLKNSETARRRVPPIIKEWADNVSDAVHESVDPLETSWEIDWAVPSGDPIHSKGGYLRKTDEEIGLLEMRLWASVGIGFDPSSSKFRPELVFNLRQYIAELTALTDAIESAGRRKRGRR